MFADFSWNCRKSQLIAVNFEETFGRNYEKPFSLKKSGRKECGSSRMRRMSSSQPPGMSSSQSPGANSGRFKTKSIPVPDPEKDLGSSAGQLYAQVTQSYILKIVKIMLYFKMI